MSEIGDSGDKSKGSESESKKPKLDPQDAKSMSSRQYLDDLIVPILLKALTSANQKRPTDPIQYIANYLLKYSEDGKETSS